MARARARRSGAARAVRAVSGAAVRSRAARPLFQVLTCPGAGHGPAPRGRVAVARADAAVASVVELADGRKTLPELAREAGLRSEDLDATLAGLADLGAVRFATGS